MPILEDERHPLAAKKKGDAALALLAGWDLASLVENAEKLQSLESGLFPHFALLVLFRSRPNTMRAIFPALTPRFS